MLKRSISNRRFTVFRFPTIRMQKTASPVFAGATSLAALAFFLSLLTSGCSTIHSTHATARAAELTAATASQYQQAVALMQEEKWQEALTRLEGITAQQPALSGPWLNLGITHTQRGNSNAAEAAFKKAIDVNAANVEAYNQLGILYRRSRRLEDARFIYEAALKIDPDNTSLHWNLGILHDSYLPAPGKALLHYQRYQQITGSDNPQLQAWIDNLAKRSRENSLAASVSP
jgi:tetratricopeptide (TPR) repeat protein